MFRLEAGEAKTLARLAERAGCRDVALRLSGPLSGDTVPADPSPRGLCVLAGLFIEAGASGPGGALLRRLASSCDGDPYLGEQVARLALASGDTDLRDAALAPARAVRTRAGDLQELDEDALRLETRRWIEETDGHALRAYVIRDLARVWHRVDRLDIALALARRAVALDPDFPGARSVLVSVLGELGAYAAAAGCLQQAEDNPDLGIERAVLKWRAGDVEGGREDLLVALATGPDEEQSPERLWNAAQAACLLSLDTGPLRQRLDARCGDDRDAAMRVLEHVCQRAGGDHRAVNIKDGLQRLLRRSGARRLQPETYILPDERLAARARVIRRPDETWLLKPARMFGGKGARLVSGEPESLDVHGSWVLQRYLDTPRLVDGHKAHMRCYLLIVPGCPRRIYVSHDGIVRLAPRPWDGGTGSDVERHITNTNLHWKTGELRIEEDEKREDSGHVRRLSAVLASFEQERGEDLGPVLHRFAAAVSCAVFADLQSPLVGLVALDLMLDDEGQFHLLEIESRPQFVAGGVPVVGRIHRTLGAEAWPILSAYLAGTELPRTSGAWRAV